MSEFHEAVRLANRVLDRPNGDPDDDLAVLARQFLRMVEVVSELQEGAAPTGAVGILGLRPVRGAKPTS